MATYYEYVCEDGHTFIPADGAESDICLGFVKGKPCEAKIKCIRRPPKKRQKKT